MFWVKHFVAVHHSHKVLGLAQINDVVRVAREHVDRLDPVPGDFPFQDLVGGVIEVPLLDEAVALDHDELLKLGVMPMLPFRDTGLRDIDRHLPGVQGMDKLREGAAVIDIRLQREGHLLLGEIA